MNTLIRNQLLGVVVTLGWANEGLPYWVSVPATIKVGCCFLLSDVYSTNSPSSCVVCLHLFHCGCFPVYLVLCLPCVYSNLMHSVSFLLTAPLCSLSLFSNVLKVSPMYTHSHSVQGICYTTPLFFHAGCGFDSLSVPGFCGVFL